MRYLFKCWDKIIPRINNASRIFLFLDYDGTLTPIVSRPADARFPRRTKSLLRRLKKNPKFSVAVISGRSLDNIKKMVGLEGIIYAGNHGLEIEGRGIRFKELDTERAVIRKINNILRKELRHFKGVSVEDKALTLSIHYRLASPTDIAAVKNKFYRLVRPYAASGRVRICSGKKVIEVRPAVDWDKGKAVRFLLKKKKKTLPVYLGDDITDEDAFRAIKDRGISIFVGSRKKTGAMFYLKNTKDVERFLVYISGIT